ncbi:hypothetical protein PENSPDRAFT_579405, partial [Peniophora sp. CONT]
GVFCALVALAVYVLVRKGLGARSQQAMLAAVLFMYAVSLTHWVLQMITLQSANVPYRESVLVKTTVPFVLLSLNVVLSDAIVLWRMCVLCNQHSFARSLALFLLLSTIGLTAATFAAEVPLFTDGGGGDASSFSTTTFGIAVLGLSLATNVVATSIIGWRVWRYRKDISAHLGSFNHRSIVEKIMTLLVESGCVYCVFWILYMIDTVGIGQINGATGPIAFGIGDPEWSSRFMPQLTGIYPTVIIVIVALEQSYMENAFSESKLSTFVQIMLAVALLMFSISLAHWIFQIHNAASQFDISPDSSSLPTMSLRIASIPMALVAVNVMLSDAVVLWRMCVLCNQHPCARALAFVLLSVTIAFGVVNAAKENSVLASERSDVTQRLFTASFGDSVYGTVVLVLSLSTNLIATVVIGWRMWCYRRDIAAHLGTFSRPSVVEKIMTLLVESGCIYCVIWVLAGGNQSGLLINGNVAWFSLVMAQLTGIYPTVILVVVALEQSYLEKALSTSKLSSFVAAHMHPTSRSRTRGPVTVEVLSLYSPLGMGEVRDGGFVDGADADIETLEAGGRNATKPGLAASPFAPVGSEIRESTTYSVRIKRLSYYL